LGEIVIKREGISKGDLLKRFTIAIPNTKTQFMKIIVMNPKKLPKWHKGAGEPSWIFVDEIFCGKNILKYKDYNVYQLHK